VQLQGGRPMMLTEFQVIKSVCSFLRKNGFQIVCSRCEIEHGIDIQALTQTGKQVSIEAKGETSSKRSSKRYGKAFNGGQVFDHVSKAFFCAARDGATGLAGVAFPKNDAHVRCVEKILPALRKLRIEVFWVLPNRKVETQGIWQNHAKRRRT
jgi:hypothetical protein